jgi:hypothetical protein
VGLPDGESAADGSVLAAIEWALVCVDAWLRVEEMKRANVVPPRKMAQDAAAARAALARAEQLSGAAEATAPRYRARKDAAEALQDAFSKNEVAAERGDLDALKRIQSAIDNMRTTASEWR